MATRKTRRRRITGRALQTLGASQSGIDSIERLFATAFELASHNLSASDISDLARVASGRLEDLQWVELARLRELEAHLGRLAQREPRRRYTLHKPERDEIISRLGGNAELQRPRSAFVLCIAIDRAFETFAADHLQPGGVLQFRHGLTAPPARFFDGIVNAPKPLGQMTPVRICQRWLRHLMVVGDPSKLQGFGRWPLPVVRHLAGRDRERLERAVETKCLTFGLVHWRKHAEVEFDVRAAQAGCFSAHGFKTATPADAIEKVMDTLSRRPAHIALFPELSLRDDEFEAVLQWLRQHQPRCPIISVLSRGHRAGAHGGMINEAVVVNSRGEVLFAHEKLEPFTLEVGNGRSELEGIVPRASDTYYALDTPVGRIVVNICRDLRSDVPALLNRLLFASVVLVPSYSPRLKYVQDEARVLGQRQSAVTMCVNSAGAAIEDAAVAYCPVARADAEPIAWTPEARNADVPMAFYECRIAADQKGVLTGPAWNPI